MKRTVATFVLVGGLGLTGLPSLAADSPPGPPPTAQAQKDRLAERSKELERKIPRPLAGGIRGPAAADVARRDRIRRQQREIDALIQRIDAGEKVAPGEVQRLLEAR